MEGLPLQNLLSSACSSFLVRGHQPNRSSKGCPKIPVYTRKVRNQIGYSRLVHCSKTPDYQDFQGYARPLRLFPTTEPNICTPSSLEEMSTSFKVDESQSLYMVKIHTSNFSGSGLSDLNAGVLLCLIDENGDSILQRMAATPMKEIALPDLLHFQRGSVDKFTFGGPKLGKIEALWVGLESGRWRLGGVNLTVVHGCQASSDNAEEERKVTQNSGLQYDFEAEDILIGEGGDMSMVELRPCHMTKLSEIEPLSLLDTSLSRSTLLLNHEIYNEESMREYADLKFSLLFYDGMLIFAGTLITAISIGEKVAFAFLTGGAVGFLYLFLLQRSVDGLPTPTSIPMNTEGGNLNQFFGRFKGPLSRLAFAFVFAVVAVKYSSGVTPTVLTPQEILVGMTGFLICKLAVVLAAFKPVPIRLKENK